MRAVVADRHGEPDVLTVKDVPEPEPGPGQVAVDVVSAGVNFADLSTLRGSYHQGGRPPLIPGLEVAGRDPRGRPVMALVSGGYAERAVADERLVFPAEGLDLAEAGGYLLVTLTAYFGLLSVARMRPGNHLLVTAGGGGLGSALIRVARAIGAEHVTAVASTDDKRRAALEAGADTAVGYDGEWPACDVFADGVGGDAFTKGVGALRNLGRALALGMACGRAPEIPTFGELRARNLGVFGFSFGTLRAADPAYVARHAPHVIALLRDGRVSYPPARRFSLDAASEALTLLGSRRTQGKLILEVGSAP
jgi:NADPH2:quinone reductase